MRKLKYTFLFVVLWICINNSINAQVNNKDSANTLNKFKFPQSLGCVSDFENILTVKEEKKLRLIIERFEKKTSNEICIVTIDSIKPYDNIADYTNDLGNAWGIGKKDKDNGLAIVISRTMRNVRVGTGIGTKKILTDSICKKVIDEMMLPEFKKARYFKGLKKGVRALITYWK